MLHTHVLKYTSVAVLLLLGGLFQGSVSVDSGPEARKQRSIALLKAQSIPFIPHLPVIQSEEETTLRTKEEICNRALALSLVAAYATGLDQKKTLELLKTMEVYDDLSPEEKAFVHTKKPDEDMKATFSWRYESLWVLLWSLGYVEKLDKPTGMCDVDFAINAIMSRSRANFIAEAQLRSEQEMLDEADLIYRYHWATTDARIKNQPVPGGLEHGTVYERHYALNWLIRFLNADWDHVRTDT